ncbi:DUF397 domain-containing protein [Streptomyces sp. NBC_01275]|uniref:DUF397 domain-containing protein n=1 Tax=Streptomyces sp. NBC_01275 TaxID=2903807 RepID=UPI00225449DA|nr:DUF397 domain-containing protein [Streptomyces sp. NBC_01275]MCX4762437.1 DUF397 domain-containing protein [Streptomyces sp. NBC_01275]
MSAGPQPAHEPVWFKSSYSGGNTTECVEAAFILSGVLVRDSKQPGHPHLTVSAKAWAGFLAGALPQAR